MSHAASWAMAVLLASATAQDNNEAVRKKLKDVEPVGSWIYDDLDAGFKKAKQTGKPMLVVFR